MPPGRLGPHRGVCVQGACQLVPRKAMTTYSTERTGNRVLSAARAPVERGMARRKSWQVLRRSRISPNRKNVMVRAGQADVAVTMSVPMCPAFGASTVRASAVANPARRRWRSQTAGV